LAIFVIEPVSLLVSIKTLEVPVINFIFKPILSEVVNRRNFSRKSCTSNGCKSYSRI